MMGFSVTTLTYSVLCLVKKYKMKCESLDLDSECLLNPEFVKLYFSSDASITPNAASC